MLNDFQMFDAYMASPTFTNLPDIEKEDFLSSYNNLLEEEMDITLTQAKRHLDRQAISDLFFQIYGHLNTDAIREKDEEWNATFGFRPCSWL